MKPMKLVAGVFVVLLILAWGGAIILVNRPDPNVDASDKGGNTAKTTGLGPDQARANMSPAVQRNATPANSPITAQANSASGNAPAVYLQMLTPEERLQKQFMREEEAKWQAEQDAKAEAYIKQDKGPEQFAQHVAPRPAVAPAGNTQ